MPAPASEASWSTGGMNVTRVSLPSWSVRISVRPDAANDAAGAESLMRSRSDWASLSMSTVPAGGTPLTVTVALPAATAAATPAPVKSKPDTEPRLAPSSSTSTPVMPVAAPLTVVPTPSPVGDTFSSSPPRPVRLAGVSWRSVNFAPRRVWLADGASTSSRVTFSVGMGSRLARHSHRPPASRTDMR